MHIVALNGSPHRRENTATLMQWVLIARIIHPSRHLPSPMLLWINILRRFVVRPLVEGNPEQFAGVLAIWKEKVRNL